MSRQRKAESVRVVLEIRDGLTEIVAVPPGIDVEIRDYDVGVRNRGGSISPLVCVYSRTKDDEVRLDEVRR